MDVHHVLLSQNLQEKGRDPRKGHEEGGGSTRTRTWDEGLSGQVTVSGGSHCQRLGHVIDSGMDLSLQLGLINSGVFINSKTVSTVIESVYQQEVINNHDTVLINSWLIVGKSYKV
jgi:hypothetical protein